MVRPGSIHHGADCLKGCPCGQGTRTPVARPSGSSPEASEVDLLQKPEDEA